MKPDPRQRANLARWRELAQKDLRGADPDDLAWESPEGIRVKPLYTAADLEDLEYVDSTPGLWPFLRGPRATMYANRPWTVRQYAGYSTAELHRGSDVAHADERQDQNHQEYDHADGRAVA